MRTITSPWRTAVASLANNTTPTRRAAHPPDKRPAPAASPAAKEAVAAGFVTALLSGLPNKRRSLLAELREGLAEIIEEIERA